MSLPDALERAAAALAQHADAVRDANGDPDGLLETLPPAGAAEVLQWLLAHESESGEELALAWSEQEAGLAPLEAVDASGLPKPARKSLRRALHRMRSRGFDLQSEDVAERVARLPTIDESIEGALVSPLDPRGSRMVYLVASHPGGGARVYEALLDAQEGVIEFRTYDTGRARARQFLRDVARRREAAMVEVEAGAARALLAQAEADQPSHRSLPRAFVEARTHLQLEEAGATPGDCARESLGAPEDGREAALGRLEQRILGRELGPWPPPASALEDVAKALQEQSSGGLVVSEATRRERVRGILGDAAGEIYDQALRLATARRLREEAFLAWRAEREDEARDCLAGAEAFEAGDGERELAVAFLEATLGPLLEQLETAPAEEEPSSLLAKP